MILCTRLLSPQSKFVKLTIHLSQFILFIYLFIYFKFFYFFFSLPQQDIDIH